ncbi:MAG: substrate-binding domain-containing protein [Kiritimatiellia bacterium]|nr:substrate-binding domain-containing protein [Kiritimatiellia bacterium]
MVARKSISSPLVLVFRSSYCEINQRSFAGLYSAVRKHGWTVHTVDYGRATGSVWPLPTVDAFRIDVPKLLDFWKPDGCVVESCIGPWSLDPKDFKSVPTVFFEYHPDQLPDGSVCVYNDGKEIAACAARELLSLGLSEYAFVPWVDEIDVAQNIGKKVVGELYWSRNRREEFAQIVRLNGKRFHTLAGLEQFVDRKDRMRLLMRWLRSLPRPCGIFAANDVVARDILDICGQIGASVPVDFSVVGVDDAKDLCENAHPTLSSVRPDNEGSGKIAVEILRSLMGQDKKSGCCFTYGAQGLVRRESTRRCPGVDARVMKAVEYIRRHACEGIVPTDVFAEMGCSRSLANLRFGQFVGHSILDEIHRIRLERVKELLLQGVHDLTDIAMLCGYASLSDLRRVFRQREGVTIGSFLRSNAH